MRQDEAGGDPKSPEEGETTQKTNMENDDREYPSKEMDKAQRALFDSLLDKLDVEFDGTDDMSRAILGRLDELLSLEKREKDHVNAEVDDAASAIHGAWLAQRGLPLPRMWAESALILRLRVRE